MSPVAFTDTSYRRQQTFADTESNGMTCIRILIPLLMVSTCFAQRFPIGTVVPVMLDTKLAAAKDRPGKEIKGRVMQEVLLPDGGRIKKLTRITGHVVSVSAPESAEPIIVLKFDALLDNGDAIPVRLGVLAVASAASVWEAQSPVGASSNVDPTSQWVTRQVGGDIVKRGLGKVFSANGPSGTWVEGSSVVIRLTPNVFAGCTGGPGYDWEQAVWIFSSTACGTYGLRGVTIKSSGQVPPTGEIQLKSTQKNLEIRGGSGWLLIGVTEP